MRCRYCAFETKVRMVAGVLPIRSASCSMNMTRGDPPSVASKELTFSSHTRATARAGCRSPRARTLFGRLAEYRVSDQSGFARYPSYSLTPDALCWVISSLTWPSGSSVIMASDVRSPSRIVWSNLERAANSVNILLKTMTYVHMYVRKYAAQYVTCCGASRDLCNLGNVGVIRGPFVGGAILAFFGAGAMQMGRRIDVQRKCEAVFAHDEAVRIAEDHLLWELWIPSGVGVIRVLDNSRKRARNGSVSRKRLRSTRRSGSPVRLSSTWLPA